MTTLTAQERKTLRAAIFKNSGKMPRGLSDAELIAAAPTTTPTTTTPTTPTTESTPMPTPTTATTATTATTEPTTATTEALAALLATLTQKPAAAPIDKAAIIAIVESRLNTPQVIEIKQLAKPVVTIKAPHHALPRLIDVLTLYPITARAPYLVGAAGSGKTTLAEQAAQSLGLPFYSTGALFDKFEILGFKNADGVYQESDCYKAFKNGGVLLFDELDGSAPEVLTAFNQLLANSTYGFPCGQVQKHKDFYIIGAGNTVGNGSEGAYIRNELDGATLDRFTQIAVNYDEKLEHTLALDAAAAVPNSVATPAALDKFIKELRKVRAFLKDNNSHIILSPRAAITGAAHLAIGNDYETVVQTNIYAQLSADQEQRAKKFKATAGA